MIFLLSSSILLLHRRFLLLILLLVLATNLSSCSKEETNNSNKSNRLRGGSEILNDVDESNNNMNHHRRVLHDVDDTDTTVIKIQSNNNVEIDVWEHNNKDGGTVTELDIIQTNYYNIQPQQQQGCNNTSTCDNGNGCDTTMNDCHCVLDMCLCCPKVVEEEERFTYEHKDDGGTVTELDIIEVSNSNSKYQPQQQQGCNNTSTCNNGNENGGGNGSNGNNGCDTTINDCHCIRDDICLCCPKVGTNDENEERAGLGGLVSNEEGNNQNKNDVEIDISYEHNKDDGTTTTTMNIIYETQQGCDQHVTCNACDVTTMDCFCVLNSDSCICCPKDVNNDEEERDTVVEPYNI